MTNQQRVKPKPKFQTKVFMTSSLATAAMAFNFTVTQPITAYATTNQAESMAVTKSLATNKANGVTPVQMVGLYHDQDHKQSILLEGDFQAGDLVQMMLNDVAYVGVVPHNGTHQLLLQVSTPVSLTKIDVAVEGQMYQGQAVVESDV
ncbi:hypothetical protein ACJQWY_05870 [Weissella kandleri]|uniref:hypothetical protein n=1 Tax=Weissella kandleri TaxID=1616 RepID=UPI00387EBB31